MYKVVRRKELAENIVLFDVEAPNVAKSCSAGQFIILRFKEYSERIPLTIADFDRKKGTITIISQALGKSTMELAELKEGDGMEDFAGPLGIPSEIEKYGTVVAVAGGVGAAPIYPIVRELKKAGNKVITILGSRNKDLMILEKELGEYSDELIIMTDDGTYGRKGLVTVPLKELLEEGNVDLVYAIGPPIMMKFACKTTEPYGVKTLVSLNSIMIDGTGMCGVCRIRYGNEIKFACVNGPEFDGHLVDWDSMLKRNTMYKEQ